MRYQTTTKVTCANKPTGGLSTNHKANTHNAITKSEVNAIIGRARSNQFKYVAKPKMTGKTCKASEAV